MIYKIFKSKIKNIEIDPFHVVIQTEYGNVRVYAYTNEVPNLLKLIRNHSLFQKYLFDNLILLNDHKIIEIEKQKTIEDMLISYLIEEEYMKNDGVISDDYHNFLISKKLSRDSNECILLLRFLNSRNLILDWRETPENFLHVDVELPNGQIIYI